MKKISFIITRAALVIVGISLSLLLVEAGLRMANYQKKEIPWRWATGTEEEYPRFFALHPKRIYAMRPNRDFGATKASDELGFRYSPSHKGNSFHQKTIVMVGDSFTYGGGVSHSNTYPVQVEKQLQKVGRDVIVHNAGVPGYGIDQEFIYLRDGLIPSFQPDIVVWNINLNDSWDSNEACLFKEERGAFEQIPAWYNILYLQGFVLKHTPHFLQDSFLLNRLLYLPTAISRRERYTIGCTLPLEASQEELNEQFSKKLKFFLGELEKIAQEKNIQVLITLVPFQFYFDEGIANDEHGLFDIYQNIRKTIFLSRLSFVDTNQALAETLSPRLLALRSNSRPIASYWDATQALGVSSENLAQELFSEEEKYGDAHLNKVGNQLLAGVVSRGLLCFLQEENSD